MSQEHFETGVPVRTYILIAVTCGAEEKKVQASLNELHALTETAGAEEAGRMIQPLTHPSGRTYFGSGKLEELKEMIRSLDADGVICDDELSPAQLNNLTEALDTVVYDRTALILMIFAGRAKTREGKIQVELAQQQVHLTRLVGAREALSRQGGSSGLHTRGAGETKLEMDRRLIRERISALKRELEELHAQRQIQRSSRVKSGIPLVCLVGYTNAGKSTLFNRMTGAGVLEEDQLFATLDITSRNLKLSSGREIVLADTVGFIQKLPHQLIDAFHATLEEVVYADVLVHVVDASDEKAESNMKVTMDAMQTLGAGRKPVITVFNKWDLMAPDADRPAASGSEETLYVSAYDQDDVTRILDAVERVLEQQMTLMEVVIPYTEGELVSLLHRKATVIEEDYRENGTYLKVQVPAEWKDRVKKYQ